MRILAVDHNALIPANLRLYELLGSKPETALRLVVPDRWHDNYSLLRWDKTIQTKSLEVVADHVRFPTRTHRMLYPGLVDQVKLFNPDILFMNAEPENAQTWQAVRILRPHPRVKLVFTSWRNIDYRRIGFPYKLQFLNAIAERAVLARAAHAIVYNSEARRIFNDLGFARTTVIPPPIDNDRFKPAEFRPLRLSDGSTRPVQIGFIGRLIAGKGVDLLLEAASGLSYPWALTIVGAGPELPSLRHRALALGIESNIKWIDGVPHNQIPEILRGLDILVLPSRTATHWKEQFGRVLIEAMASGVAVIGSRSGEIPNVIGNTGILVPEGDAVALRKAVHSLTEDDMTRRTSVNRGLERVRAEFSINSAAERHFSLFQSLM